MRRTHFPSRLTLMTKRQAHSPPAQYHPSLAQGQGPDLTGRPRFGKGTVIFYCCMFLCSEEIPQLWRATRQRGSGWADPISRESESQP